MIKCWGDYAHSKFKIPFFSPQKTNMGVLAIPMAPTLYLITGL
jgi:hypothetical protein